MARQEAPLAAPLEDARVRVLEERCLPRVYQLLGSLLRDPPPSSKQALHTTPYTLHPTPYTLYPSPYTLHISRFCKLFCWRLSGTNRVRILRINFGNVLFIYGHLWRGLGETTKAVFPAQKWPGVYLEARLCTT